MHYGSQKEEDMRVQNIDDRHQHQQPQKTLPFVKIPSFNGDSDLNIYLGWEANVEQILCV